MARNSSRFAEWNFLLRTLLSSIISTGAKERREQADGSKAVKDGSREVSEEIRATRARLDAEAATKDLRNKKFIVGGSEAGQERGRNSRRLGFSRGVEERRYFQERFLFNRFDFINIFNFL